MKWKNMQGVSEMDLGEKTLDSKSIFSGRIIKVRVDQVELPDGRVSTREIVEHAPAVAVVALTEDGELLLVRQYRKPIEQHMLEIPAGLMETGETPLDSARRELAEETGFRADKWEKLSSFYTTPGFSDEVIHLFLASDLKVGATHLDEDEFVEVQKLSLPEALRLIEIGELIDAKSIIGIQTVALRGHR
jgi:ADP-ribose pyrophosphatase